MKTLFTSILFFNLALLKAQTIQTTPTSTGSKKEFKNYGEQEDSLSRHFFEENYSRQEYKKYDNLIIISGDTVKYSDKYFLVWIPAKFKKIFSTGIIYPSIMIGQSNRYHKLTVANFEELTFLNNSPTKKRFRFWLTGKGEINPTVCFIELTNLNATDKTDIASFIDGAILTFYKAGWFII